MKDEDDLLQVVADLVLPSDKAAVMRKPRQVSEVEERDDYEDDDDDE